MQLIETVRHLIHKYNTTDPSLSAEMAELREDCARNLRILLINHRLHDEYQVAIEYAMEHTREWIFSGHLNCNYGAKRVIFSPLTNHLVIRFPYVITTPIRPHQIKQELSYCSRITSLFFENAAGTLPSTTIRNVVEGLRDRCDKLKVVDLTGMWKDSSYRLTTPQLREVLQLCRTVEELYLNDCVLDMDVAMLLLDANLPNLKHLELKRCRWLCDLGDMGISDLLSQKFESVDLSDSYNYDGSKC